MEHCPTCRCARIVPNGGTVRTVWRTHEEYELVQIQIQRMSPYHVLCRGCALPAARRVIEQTAYGVCHECQAVLDRNNQQGACHATHTSGTHDGDHRLVRLRAVG